MTFTFNAKKTAQAAFKLLSLAGGRMNYMVLVKLLYLADRKALMELESPVTGDRMLSLQHGPILSRVLNLIKEGPLVPEDEPWFDAVSPRDGYDVRALQDPGDDELSNAEEAIVEQTFIEFGHMSWKQMSVLTHRLPEWEDPVGSAIPIRPEQILLLAGRTADDLSRIAAEQDSLRHLDEVLERYAIEETASR